MITLLPEQAKKSIRTLYRTRVAVTALFFFAWLTIICIVFLVPTLIISNEKRIHAEALLVSLEKTTTATTTTPLRATVASINKNVGLFTTTPQKTITAQILDPLLLNKSKGITITDMQITRNEKNNFDVSIVGVAADRDVLGAYAKSLEGVQGVTAVTVPLDTYLKGTTLPMHIDLQITL